MKQKANQFHLSNIQPTSNYDFELGCDRQKGCERNTLRQSSDQTAHRHSIISAFAVRAQRIETINYWLIRIFSCVAAQ